MKVLTCGDRDWSDWTAIRRALSGLGPLTVIVHGDARGADKMCGYVAREMGYVECPHAADWKRHGKAAGPIRNQGMLDAHADIELVLAFHDDLQHSRGTKDMVEKAQAKGIPINYVTTEGW